MHHAPSGEIPFADYACEKTRYRVLKQLDRRAARTLADGAQHDIGARWALYESLSKR